MHAIRNVDLKETERSASGGADEERGWERWSADSQEASPPPGFARENLAVNYNLWRLVGGIW